MGSNNLYKQSADKNVKSGFSTKLSSPVFNSFLSACFQTFFLCCLSLPKTPHKQKFTVFMVRLSITFVFCHTLSEVVNIFLAMSAN